MKQTFDTNVLTSMIKGESHGALEKLYAALEPYTQSGPLADHLKLATAKLPTSDNSSHSILVAIINMSDEKRDRIRVAVVMNEESTELLDPGRIQDTETNSEVEFHRGATELASHPVVTELLNKVVSEAISMDVEADDYRTALIPIARGFSLSLNDENRPTDEASEKLLMRVLYATLPEAAIRTMRPDPKEAEFQVMPLVTPGSTEATATGYVTRNDITTRVNMRQKQARNDRSFQRNAPEDKLSGGAKEIVNVSSYFDVRPAIEDADLDDAIDGVLDRLEGRRSRNRGGVPNHLRPFANTMVITDVVGGDGSIANIEQGIFGILCAAFGAGTDGRGVSLADTYYANIMHEDSPSYLGALNAANPVVNEAMRIEKSDYVPESIQLADDTVAKNFLAESFNPEAQDIVIDAARGVTSSHLFDAILDSIEVDENGDMTDAAEEASTEIYEALDTILGGKWKEFVKDYASDNTVLPQLFYYTDILVPMGYYERDGVKHDLRTVDFVRLATIYAKNDPDALESILDKYNDATNISLESNREESEALLFANDLKEIVSEAMGGAEVVITGYARKVQMDIHILESIRKMLMSGEDGLVINGPERREERSRRRGAVSNRNRGAVLGGLGTRSRGNEPKSRARGRAGISSLV